MKQYIILVLAALLFSTAAFALEKPGTEQSKKVNQHVQQVTPYALDQTLLTFTKTPHGGVQHVVAKSANNTKQIKLIQAHLRELADQFSNGDFSVPESIHGPDMPGLAQMKKAEKDDIHYEYKALENGAQIHYGTEFPPYVRALHEWFDVQASDHGNAELPQHSQHHLTPAE